MPLSTRPLRATDGLGPEDLLVQEKAKDPTGGELAGALWRTSWTGGGIDWLGEAYASSKGAAYADASPDYHYDLRKLDKKYYGIAEDILDATSEGEVNALMKDHDRVMADQETIAAAGIEGILYGGLTAILDPVTLPLWVLPFGQGFQAAGTLGKMGRLTGLTLAEISAGEAIMHHVDRSRDPNETAKNLFITATMASALGALAGRMGRKLPPEVKDQLVNDMAKEADKQYDILHASNANRSVGAAQVAGGFADPAMEAPEKGWKIQKLLIQTPILRTAYSTDVGLAEPAKFLPELTLSGIRKNKHLLNIADDHPPVDWLVDRERRSLGNTLHAMKQVKRDILANHGDDLTRNEISQMISRAAAYDDNHALYAYHKKYPELTPLVEEARRYRKSYEARMKAGGVGMLDPAVVTRFNAHYGPRIYNEVEIRNKPTEWVEAVRAGYRSMGDPRTDDELRERAMEAFYNAATASKLHGAAGFAGLKAPLQTTQSALKQISLEIPDEFVEKFLIRDVINDHDHMIRQLLPEIILRERYSDVERTAYGLRVNYIENRYKEEFREKHQAILSAVEKRATQLRAAGNEAEAVKTEQRAFKKAEKLRQAHETHLKDLQHILQKVSGVGQESIVLSGPVAEFLSELRAYAAGAHLGNSALASLHEPITAMMVMGFTPVARGARVFLRNWQATAVEREKLRAWGAGMDLRAHVSTARARAEIDDPGLTKGWKSWGRRKVAPFMYRWNGQDIFNASGKTAVGQAMQDMILRHALGIQSAKAGTPEFLSEIDTMAMLGVDEAVMRGIQRNIKAGRYKEIDGSLFADVDAWDDTFLKDRFTEAVAMFGDITIVSHSSGALPRILDNQVGRMLTQYRNVFFNMQSKVIIPIAQRLARGDLRTARFLMASFSSAWLIYQVRMLGRNDWNMEQFQKEWDTMAIQDHVRAAVETSGLSALTFELLGGADNLSNGNASRMLHLNESTKNYYNRNLGLTGLAPAISWADKVTRGTVGAAVSGGWTQADINGLGYSIPGRSIPYLDPPLDAIQNAIVEQFPTAAESQRTRQTRSKTGVDF